MISLFLLLGTAWAQPSGDDPATTAAPAGATTDLSVVIFEDGLPVPGVSIVVEGELVGTTDDVGSVEAEIPSGRQYLQMFRGDDPVVELDLLTLEGEVVQVIVTLVRGQSPRLDIETSADQLPLASERTDEPQQVATPEDALPPGALVGRIVSAEDQRPVVRARVFFTGTDVETRTDADGDFAVELPAGTYSLSVVHPNFSTQTLDNIRVIAEQEVTANIELTPAGIQLQEYVVTAPYVEGSISEMLAQQRETSSVVEVLGAEQMSASGDSNAAQALQRVSGLTVEQGKFVLVRGQPYRYTYTLWNGSPLPSPEPLVRVVPLDLFPTGVLSGIEVQKSYSADLPASFGAGLINLQTRGVPEEAFVDLQVQSNYNSFSTFGRGLTYPGGGLDFFGYDDGTRALPQDVQDVNAEMGDLTELSQDEQYALAREFAGVYQPVRRVLPPDFGLSLAGGGSVGLPGDGKLGAVAAVKFSNTWRFQDRTQNSYGLYAPRINDGLNPLAIQDALRQERTDNNANLGGIATVQGIWDHFELSSNTFYAHQTQQRTERTTGELTTSDDKQLRGFLLSWIERELLAQQVSGKAELGPLTVEARGMVARAGRDAPDRRETNWSDLYPYSPDGTGEWEVEGDSGANRNFSTVVDVVQNYSLDLGLLASNPDERWLGLSFKVGAAGDRLEREAVTRYYTFAPRDESCPTDQKPDEPCGAPRFYEGTDSDALYEPSNIGPGRYLDFTDASRSTKDDYIGSQRVFGVYGLTDVRLGDLVRLVGGLRYERAELDVTTYQVSADEENASNAKIVHSQRCFGQIRLKPYPEDDPRSLDRPGAPCALYPSLSSTFFLGEQMQVRVAYGRTTSRPNLNELSDTSFVDPDTGEVFLGRTDLLPAVINGFDARWEWYPSTTESLTFGGFIKDYTNPIERTFLARGGTKPVPSFQNAATARVRGLEVGGRIEFVENLYATGNVAILDSLVILRDPGLDTNPERALDGQAKYTVNLQAGYSGDRHDATLSLNVIGARLHRAGAQGQPDIIFRSIPGLNAVWSWKALETDRYVGGIKLQASNLLNPTARWTQQYTSPDDAEIAPGRTFPEKVWRRYQRGWNLGAQLTFGIR